MDCILRVDEQHLVDGRQQAELRCVAYGCGIVLQQRTQVNDSKCDYKVDTVEIPADPAIAQDGLQEISTAWLTLPLTDAHPHWAVAQLPLLMMI